jgi:general secretion pathway protein K
MGAPNRDRQTGLALITVILVVAIVATIASFLSLDQQVWLRQAQNLQDSAQAEALRRGAIDAAAALLDEDGKSNQVDDLTEPWAKPLPPFAFGNGSVTISIEDAQGRFNLNNLLTNGKPSQADMQMYRRLLAYRKLDPDLVDPLVDWMDSDSQPRPGGAEDSHYLSLNPPYRAANQPLSDVEELRLVSGYTPKVIAALSGLVVALPERTPININTAKPEVLGALFASMSLDQARTLAQNLASSPLTSTSQLAGRAPGQNLQPIQISVKTGYFLVSVEPDLGRYHQRTITLLHRPGGNQQATAVWRDRPAIVVAKSRTNG